MIRNKGWTDIGELKDIPTSYAKINTLVVYCDQCNQYFVEERNFEKLLLLKTCPVCGKRLSSHNFYTTADFSCTKRISFCKAKKHTEMAKFIDTAWTEIYAIPSSYDWYNRTEKFVKAFGDGFSDGDSIVLDNFPATVHIHTYKSTYYSIEFYKDNEDFLNYLKNFNDAQINKQLDKKHENFVNACIAQGESINASQFEITSLNLKSYIEHIFNIEKNIYSVGQRLRELYRLEQDSSYKLIAATSRLNQKQAAKFDEKIQNATKELIDLKKRDVAKELSYQFPIVLPPKPAAQKKPTPPIEPCKPLEPIEPTKPVLQKPSFFNKKKIIRSNAAIMELYEKQLENYKAETEKYFIALNIYNESRASYETKLEEYENAMEDYKNTTKRLDAEYKQTCKNIEKQSQHEYEAAVKQETAAWSVKIKNQQAKRDSLLKEREEALKNAENITTPEKAKFTIIKEEIETAESLLTELYKALYQLYSCNIVFPKYRNIVAISSLYEYLSSGRCDSLEGANGAYNLYESELRMNTVIGQLNQVIESLEQIKQNQYMIYSAIHNVTKQLAELNYSMDSALDSLNSIGTSMSNMESHLAAIKENTKVISYNTQCTAYYSQKNAELTNALGYLIALK